MGLLTDKENGLLNEASLAEAKKAKILTWTGAKLVS